MGLSDIKSADKLIRAALAEDIGKADITTRLCIPKDKKISAVLLVKEPCVLCGLPVVERVFKVFDGSIKFKALAKDGQVVKNGAQIARVFGNARSILTAERVALNFLGILCAVATKTKDYVCRVKPFKVKIVDTRKTIPGLRELQKYAVRVGGGYNHRMSLDEMILIKDNHIGINALGVGAGVGAGFSLRKIMQPKGCGCRPSWLPMRVKIEIEVDNLKQFKAALEAYPDIIMLDNMSVKDIKAAVKLRNSNYPRVKLEASGGVNLKTIRRIAGAGVDIISVGDLTHSVNSIDVSLEIQTNYTIQRGSFV